MTYGRELADAKLSDLLATVQYREVRNDSLGYAKALEEGLTAVFAAGHDGVVEALAD